MSTFEVIYRYFTLYEWLLLLVVAFCFISVFGLPLLVAVLGRKGYIDPKGFNPIDLKSREHRRLKVWLLTVGIVALVISIAAKLVEILRIASS